MLLFTPARVLLESLNKEGAPCTSMNVRILEPNYINATWSRETEKRGKMSPMQDLGSQTLNRGERNCRMAIILS